jgi:Flp pilus assembly protein TadD
MRRKIHHAELVFICALVLLAISAHLRNFAWKNELTLWQDVAIKSPQKVAPYLNLGNAMVRRGALFEAQRWYERALEVNPLDIRVINGLAVIFFRQHRYDEAVRLFELLANEKPDEPYFQNNLGVAYLKKGELAKAERHFQVALRLRPSYADAHSNQGLVYREQQRLRESAESFRKALEINPDHPDARRNLGEIQFPASEAR